MKFIYSFLILSLLTLPIFAQTVTEVECEQVGKTIVISYTLDKLASIELWYSDDGGNRFQGPLRYVSGDVGYNVEPGKNTIVWDVLKEVNALTSTQVVFKVVPFCLDVVDLGLKVMWASCNLGATKPNMLGEYYAWGEISVKEKFNEDTYLYKAKQGFSKYNNTKLGSEITNDDDLFTLETTDDVAYIKLGNKWRIPTLQDWQELRNKCSWVWSTRQGIKGYLISGPNGRSIFLPVTGYIIDSSTFQLSCGSYWSSSLDDYISRMAWNLGFDDQHSYMQGYTRFRGCQVRPVLCK